MSFLVEQYTGVLGFILRSTNVRNAFEIHYPLKRIVNEVIDPETKLLISSEWDFVPFTYPMSLDILPEFVLVGSPAPESGNILLAPLAGHEIGHSAWRQSSLRTDLEDQFSAAVEAELSSLSADKKELFSELKLGDLGFELLKKDCAEFGILQLEEIFCDLFGLRLFEDSYVYAFEYFLAPGGEEVSLEYPSSMRRMEIIEDASKDDVVLEIHSSHFQNWLASTSTSERELVLVDIIDKSCRPFVPRLINEVLGAINEAVVPRLRRDVVKEIVKAFNHSEPFREAAALSEIVTAGWITVIARDGMPLSPKDFRVLNDLMLKTIEVTEYVRKFSGVES